MIAWLLYTIRPSGPSAPERPSVAKLTILRGRS